MISPNDKLQIEKKEDYLKAYIGENYQNIRKKRFSIVTLIFGPFYLIYKKIYIPGIILLGVLGMAYYYNSEVGLFLTIVLNLFLGYKFNTIYYEHAKKKIDEIKIRNPNKSKEELLDICKQKGKPLMVLVIFIAFIFMIVCCMIPFLLKKEEVIEDSIKESKIHDLSYKIPEGFQSGTYLSKDYLTYHYQKDDNHCIIHIKVLTKTNMNQYIKSYYNQDSNTLPKETINNWNWRRIQNDYIIEINNLVYDVNYESIKDSNCDNLKQEFISSLDFPEIDQ